MQLFMEKCANIHGSTVCGAKTSFRNHPGALKIQFYAVKLWNFFYSFVAKLSVVCRNMCIIQGYVPWSCTRT